MKHRCIKGLFVPENVLPSPEKKKRTDGFQDESNQENPLDKTADTVQFKIVQGVLDDKAIAQSKFFLQ